MPAPSLPHAAEVDRLSGDDELDRERAVAQLDLLGEAPRGKRRELIRSSIPRACVVLDSSKETGCASRRASDTIAWAATPNSASASSARPSRAASPSGSPE